MAKIIGKTTDGFIVQMEERELARLVGFYSASDCRKQLEIGAEIKINAMFEQLYSLRHIKGQIKGIADSAQVLMDTIRIKSPIIEPVIDKIIAAEPKSQ